MYLQLANGKSYQVKNVRNLLEGEEPILQIELDIETTVSLQSVYQDFAKESLTTVRLYSSENQLLEQYQEFSGVTRAEKYFYGDQFMFTVTLK